ncbi:MAG: phosphoadenosine phosphosulfate reductase family protein [Candidatus Thermoplasmatota archaeon]
MGAVRLGKVHLHWCTECNLPLVEEGRCGICGGSGSPVRLTPPGDARPAFDGDLALIREMAEKQFGSSAGHALIPPDNLVVLNKVPALDRMVEIVCGGKVIGSLRYDPGTGYTLLLRPEGAIRAAGAASRSYVVADDGAVQSILSGRSLMAVGVLDADPEINAGDEVIILSRERRALAVGTARMSGKEMMEKGRGAAAGKHQTNSDVLPRTKPHNRVVKGGAAVKNRHPVSADAASPSVKPATWKSAVETNRHLIQGKAGRAAAMIRSLDPSRVFVSFSGGKDSLAVLLLALDAGLTPPMLFVDTGIELPETIAHVHSTAERYNLPLIIEEAGDIFWRAVEHFGPPGKDFRWCCKTCKLSPVARFIKERYPNGAIALIGQRRYESESRRRHGGVWNNPWVPGQRGVSPIQHWTALHVWLYIFMKEAEYNPWYERGMDRIGCFPCPSADLADIELMRLHCPGYARWDLLLANFAEEHALPEDWLRSGLWRWKHLPEALAGTRKAENVPPRNDIRIPAGELARAGRLMSIVGVEKACISGRGNSANAQVVSAKLLWCVKCGLCITRCPRSALYFNSDGKLDLHVERCTGCGTCIRPCPVVDFEPRT